MPLCCGHQMLPSAIEDAYLCIGCGKRVSGQQLRSYPLSNRPLTNQPGALSVHQGNQPALQHQQAEHAVSVVERYHQRVARARASRSAELKRPCPHCAAHVRSQITMVVWACDNCGRHSKMVGAELRLLPREPPGPPPKPPVPEDTGWRAMVLSIPLVAWLLNAEERFEDWWDEA